MPAEVTLQFTLIWLACLVLIWLPGAALARLLRLPSPADWLLRSALEIGLGLSVWPLLLLWSTFAARPLAGLSWSPVPARIVVAALCLAALIPQVRAALRGPDRLRRGVLRQWPWLLLFAALLALAWYTRQRHIRDLVLPNWVDSIHHLLIVRLIVEQGALPDTYAPYMAGAGFSYHWGFHAWAAWLAWLLGATDSFDLARLLLIFGQVLNALMLWMLYAAGRTLFNSRRAGFLAAALGMFVSWLPAYYTAWGRYTHLAGLLLAIPLLISLWRLARARGHVHAWLLATSLLAATLALTHVRVALFAAIWAALLLIVLAVQRNWRAVRRWIIAGALALLLNAPWLATLAAHPRSASLVAGASAAAVSWQTALDRIPWQLVWTPGMRELVALATAGIAELLAREHPVANLRLAAGAWLLLVAGILLWQRRSGREQPALPWRPLALLAAWCATVAAVLNTDALGLPRLPFLSLNAAAITLFLPASLAAAGLVAWASGAVIPPRRARLAVLVLTAALAGHGAANMRDIINPQTVLVASEDMPALTWIRDHTPPDARFAVNAWRWFGVSYAGSDAGYWIPALTDRQSILPPALYALTLEREQILQINSLLDAWTASPDLSDPALINRLRAEGVTHIYLGGRSDPSQAEALANLPALELLYARGSVYIFRLKQPHETALNQGTP